ncbi:MAG: hypothetical protein HRU13_08400 [Phycisphaerales bacterium]|nr:hypothetical protein [Phycisphaerales bacterium]
MPQNARETLVGTTDGVTRFTESGENWRRGTIVERVVQSAAAEGPLKQKLPPNAFVTYWDVKNITALTLTTANSIALGTSADPDAIGELDSITTTIDATNSGATTVTRLSRDAESDLVITSTNGSGAETGDWAGTVDVVIHFIQFQGAGQSLP